MRFTEVEGIFEKKGFEGLLEAITDELCRHKESCQRGLISKDEFADLTFPSRSFFGQVIHCIGVNMSRTDYYWQPFGGLHDEQRYQRFSEEWNLWKQNASETVTVGKPWLFTKKEPWNIEASIANKHKVFQFLETLMIPVICFKPCPEDIPCPRLVIAHQYHSRTRIWVEDEIQVDNGLLSEKEPAGKTFNLLLTSGVTANITITEIDDKTIKGEGTLDGYALCDYTRDIIIETDGYISFAWENYPVDGNDISDWDVIAIHPLWSKFREWNKKRAWDSARNKLIEDFLSN